MNYKLSLAVFLIALAALACGPAANSPATSPGSDTGSAGMSVTVPPPPGSQAEDGVLPATVPSPASPEAGAAVPPVEPPAALPSLGTEFPTIAPTLDLPATKAALEAIDAHRRQVELATRTAIEAQQEAERYAAALEATRVAELPTPTPLPTVTPYPTPIPQPTYPPQPTQTPKMPYPAELERTVSRETFEQFERMCLNGKLWQEPFYGGRVVAAPQPSFNGDYTRERIAGYAWSTDKSEIHLYFGWDIRLICIEVSLNYILDFEFDCPSKPGACALYEPRPFRLTGPGNYLRFVIENVYDPSYQFRDGTWKMRYTCVAHPCGETVARMLELRP